MAWSHGTFHWNELMTWDVEQAKKFYADTLGWTYDAMPMEEGTYWIMKSGDTVAGGMFQLTKPLFEGVPEGWMAYIAVDDIDARVAKATTAGAALMRPPSTFPGSGASRSCASPAVPGSAG